MFHSSSSRHERYLVRSHKKAIIKRTSLESEISGADSGYTSSSSTTTATTSPSTSTSHVTSDDLFSSSSAVNVGVGVEKVAVKKKSKRHQPPRQPDLVYSCPRPLAFPFHNDDHFLPIAEADPRDVARVSPSLDRSASLHSSKTSVVSKTYDYPASKKGLDTESSYSHQSSILSTIQRGTVRSIRSLFQLPKDSLSRIPTTTTSNTQQHDSLQRLEIKKGTVQSIKDMFSKKKAVVVHHTPAVVPQPRQTGLVGATIGHFEGQPKVFKPVAVNVTKPDGNKKSSFSSRASEFASRALWSSNKQAETKSLSARIFPKTWSHVSLDEAPSPPTVPPKAPQQQQKDTTPKKSIFAVFKRSTVPKAQTEVEQQPKKSFFSAFKKGEPTSVKPTMVKPVQPATKMDPSPPPPTTTVRKMWKSFKNLVSGKKSSRVGVL